MGGGARDTKEIITPEHNQDQNWIAYLFIASFSLVIVFACLTYLVLAVVL